MQNLQPLTTPRMEHEPMPTQRVLTNHRSHPLRQPVEPAAHVHGLTRQPDPRFLRAVHRLQTRQPDHDAVSNTASNARTCSASNPRPTTRLRPFCSRTSTRVSPAAFGAASLSCTSRNFTAVSSRNRFFHAKKYGLHRPRPRQNAVTVCPLRACSEISLRHFVRAFFPRLVMSQPCTATRSFTRWGSLNAHALPRLPRPQPKPDNFHRRKPAVPQTNFQVPPWQALVPPAGREFEDADFSFANNERPLA